MLKRLLCLSVLTVLLIVPFAALGQNLPPGKWWEDSQVAKRLNLDETQISQLDKLFIESTRKLFDLKNAVQKEQFEFNVLLDEESLDEKAVLKQLEKLDKQRAALNAEMVRMVLEARHIIGYESFKMLKEHMEKMAKQKMRRFIGQEAGPPDKPKPQQRRWQEKRDF